MPDEILTLPEVATLRSPGDRGQLLYECAKEKTFVYRDP
jgi:hypothetical protein